MIPPAEFLDALARDLTPVEPASSLRRTAATWFCGSALFVAFAMLALGPLRSGFKGDLGTLRLLSELALGSAAAIALLVAGLELGVPGAPKARQLLTPAILLSAGFIGLTLFADGIPGPVSSMVGKRAHCFLEGLALALPPYVLALSRLRRRILFHRAICGAAVGAASAMIPALFMQIACMYEPAHAMSLHFPPILIVALLGAAVANRILPRA
jgi:hypothetical protein